MGSNPIGKQLKTRNESRATRGGAAGTENRSMNWFGSAERSWSELDIELMMNLRKRAGGRLSLEMKILWRVSRKR